MSPRTPVVSDVARELDARAVRSEADVRERLIALDYDGTRLFGVLTEPGTSTRRHALVICPSLFEMPLLQRSEVSLAREAARLGFASIYVQPPGTGDSEGSPGETTIQSRLGTAVAAARHLRAHLPDVELLCLLGARLGGAVATMAHRELPESDSLALWDPSFDASGYWKRACRADRIIAVGRRQRTWRDPHEQLENRGRASVLKSVITPALLADLDRMDEAVKDPIEADHVLMITPRLSTGSGRLHINGDLTRVDVEIDLRNRFIVWNGAEAIAPTATWLDRTLD